MTSLNLKSIVREHVDKKARIITDDLNVYRGLRYEFRATILSSTAKRNMHAGTFTPTLLKDTLEY